MSTPYSTSVPYASVADLRARKDIRQLADLVNDDGTRATTTAAGLDGNAIIITALLDASGLVEAAALKGNRYTIADLQVLTGASKQLLIKMVCELAFWNLWTRRHPEAAPTPAGAWAFDLLDQLAQGARILGLSEHAAADTPDNDFLTAAENERRNLASVQASRVFGRRSWRYQPGTSSSASSDDC